MRRTSEIETQINEEALTARMVPSHSSRTKTPARDSISIIGEGYSPPSAPPNRSGEAFRATQAEYDGTEKGIFEDYDCLGDPDGLTFPQDQ